MNGTCRSFILLVCLILTACSTKHTQRSQSLTADNLLPTEGMWLPNALPVDRLRKFNFKPTQAWVDHLQRASVHIGASGAFVSSDGLVLTNHHVAAEGLQNISNAGKDYITDGFLARTRDEEIKLPGLELDVLQSIEDVTARVNAAVDESLPTDEAVKQRHAVFADIERQSQDATGLQSRVVTLYGGAMYHLYRYKRYIDVRAVFAPEASSAFFGGDPDNFEYPRYDLDIALIRAYEDGKPARVEHYLKLSAKGVSEGDLVFVSGHPGRTDRLLPASVLRGMRDRTLPLRIEGLERMEKALFAYSARGPEQRRQAQEEIFYVQNSLKATRPRLTELKQGMVERKQREEDALRAQLKARPDLRKYAAAWERMDAAEMEREKLDLREYLLEEGHAWYTDLCYHAKRLVRMVAEDQKPDAQRLPEYSKSKRAELEHDLFADYPIYPELEIAKLTVSLELLRDKLGADAPEVKTMLRGKEPQARAEELVNGSKLTSAAERRRVYDGGVSAMASSTDTMIQLARAIDAESRAVRLAYEARVQEPQTQALTDINHARFALLGSAVYPDATGTLRLAFGIVKGYEQDGEQIPPWTTIGGAFVHEQKHGAKDPFKLPRTWSEAREKVDPQTPLNFVCTADITGGNSGSPVISREGELVGVIFDSNRQGVPDNLHYTDKQARAVSVDSRAILEALKNIYHADDLVTELTRK